mmetsp:Transcript_34544/g.71909  ORF Transcript_34544/g.71909 Transcript_34544/m.71909 type:complete len:102 (+) Transcript_34544:759-1064(+)
MERRAVVSTGKILRKRATARTKQPDSTKGTRPKIGFGIQEHGQVADRSIRGCFFFMFLLDPGVLTPLPLVYFWALWKASRPVVQHATERTFAKRNKQTLAK